MVCGIKFGEKPPYEDRSYTHGLCEECLPKEIERLKKEKEKWIKIKFRENKGGKHMERRNPKVGDIVLWENSFWIINKIRGYKETPLHGSRVADIQNLITGELDSILVDTLELTDMRIWEAQ